jgi:hypothetical protein
MIKNSFFFILFFLNFNIHAQTIADCKNPEGYAYYHHQGIVPKKSSGFQDDKITGGITTIKKMANGKFDILIVDIRKKIISMVEDGGTVMLLRAGEKDATFLLYFPNMTIELYTIWIDSEGNHKFDILQSKGGDAMPVHKSSVLVGSCDSINFDLIGK